MHACRSTLEDPTARGLDAESFAHLVDRSASGIRTDVLAAEIAGRGWQTRAVGGDARTAVAELAAGRPVLALIEDRPGTYHYVVVVAWQARGVVFHDPARAPFRVMAEEEFVRRWRAADSWMLIVAPGERPTTPVDSDAAPAPGSDTAAGSCEQLVAGGVAAAQRNDLAGAERALSAALSCPGAAAPRELAGVRALQRRWPEAAQLATAAAAADPADAYAWKLLGTARFVQDDRAGALAAWNHAGEPRVDLVRIDGLARTRHRVVEQLIGVQGQSLLTRVAFDRARRRLDELPAASATRLDYAPVPGGLVELRGAVVERAVIPTGRVPLAALGLTAAVRREVRVTLGSPTGGGEAITARWRFWPDRPLVGAGITAPAPFGGIWSASVEGERQPFDRADVATVRRRAARAAVGNWLSGGIRWEAGGGVEHRADAGRFGIVTLGAVTASPGDRVVGRAAAERWMGDQRGFGTLAAAVALRSRVDPRGVVVVGTAAVHRAGGGAPLDLWPAGDTGHTRGTLLRAHPALDGGRLRVERLGRTLAAGTLEGQHWWRRGLINVGAAAFVDVARTADRVVGGPLTDVDAGTGLRLRFVGITGVFRVDVAHGLRDGANALSVGYTP